MFACNAQFSMHWGGQCAAPNHLLDVGPGSAPKGASSGLGGGANPKSFVLYRVGKMFKSMSVFLKCAVFNASGAEVSRPQRVAMC